MKEWIEKVWKPYTLNQLSLLILDDYKANKTENIRRIFDESNTELAMVLPGYTAVSQVLDVGINMPVKQYVRTNMMFSWLQRIRKIKSLVRGLLIGSASPGNKFQKESFGTRLTTLYLGKHTQQNTLKLNINNPHLLKFQHVYIQSKACHSIM